MVAQRQNRAIGNDASQCRAAAVQQIQVNDFSTDKLDITAFEGCQRLTVNMQIAIASRSNRRNRVSSAMIFLFLI